VQGESERRMGAKRYTGEAATQDSPAAVHRRNLRRSLGACLACKAVVSKANDGQTHRYAALLGVKRPRASPNRRFAHSPFLALLLI
jgi:hypothetical protein